MIRLVQLLNEKNHFLEKFYSLNESQINMLQQGMFDDIERFYRDAKLCEVGEGTNEIQRIVIARHALKESGVTDL